MAVCGRQPAAYPMLLLRAAVEGRCGGSKGGGGAERRPSTLQTNVEPFHRLSPEQTGWDVYIL